jgi:hypothetical protein
MKKSLISLCVIGSLAFLFSVLSASPVHAQGGILIKGTSFTSVYYLAENGKRYVFPNNKAYMTWYADFSGVTVISDHDLASLPLGGNVTYKPGKKLVKITTDPKVYAVGGGGVLRWVTTEALAAQLYGSNWNQQIDDVPDFYFVNYTVGAPILSASDFLPSAEMSAAAKIDDDIAARQTTAQQGQAVSSCDHDIWSCGDWTSCSGQTTKSRECELIFDCPNVSTAVPAVTDSCTAPTSCSADTWSCGAWSACSISGQKTRSCSMTYDCPGIVTQSPAPSESCTPTTSCGVDSWSCGSWSSCSGGGMQTRTCSLTNDCPLVSTPRPAEVQTCTSECSSKTHTLNQTFNGPASQNIAAGSKKVELLNFSLLAKSDLEIKQTRFTFGGTLPLSKLTNVELIDTNTGLNIAGPYDAASQLNMTEVYELSRCQTRTIKLVADIDSSAANGNTVFVTLKPFYDIAGSVHDLQESKDLTVGDYLITSDMIGNTHTISAGGQARLSGQLSVIKAPDDAESAAGTVAGGSSNVVLGKLQWSAQHEEMKVIKAEFSVNAPDGVLSLGLYDGSTLVAGPAGVNGATGAVDFTDMNFVVPENGDKVMTIKGSLASVGQSGVTAGTNVRITLNSVNFEARGTASGSSTIITSLSNLPLAMNDKILQ